MTTHLHSDASQAANRWKLDPGRVRRALALVEYEKVRQGNFDKSDPAFDVFSLSRPGLVHTVNPSRHTCTCEDHTFNHQICKHRIAVYLYQQRLKRAAAQKQENQLIQDLGF